MTPTRGGFCRQCAASAKAESIFSYVTVDDVQERRDARKLREDKEWPPPPNGTGNVHIGICATENAVIGGEEFHFEQRFAVPQIEAQPNPIRLKRGQMPAVMGEELVGAPCPAGAEGAIGVVKDPAANGFCCFCIHRNDWLKFFRCRA